MTKPKIKVAAQKAAKPSIKKPAAVATIKPRVFYDCHRRIHLLLTEADDCNRYLAVRDEELQVVALDHGTPARDDKDQLKTQETTCVCELTVCPNKDGQPYDLTRAAQKFWDSVMARTAPAVKELCLILGKPVPEITEEVKMARKAAGERLKNIQQQYVKPADSALLLAVKDAEGTPDTSRGVYLLQWIRDAKKGITMGDLYKKHDGKPTHVAVAKLILQGLVKIK